MPGVLLALVAAGALALVVTLGPEERGTAAPPVEVDAEVLSARRLLDPLVTTAGDLRLRRRLDEFVAGQPADTCLAVEAGAVSYAHRVDDPQVPASVQKLLTAEAALTELGPEARFETTVAGALDGGVVAGDLHLVGGGDPLLSQAGYAARFRNQPQVFSDVGALADAVVAAGVREVRGAVVGDESRYDQVRYNPLWPSRFVTQNQTGPLSALLVDDGFAEFPASGAGPVTAAPDPAAHAASVLDALLRARGVVVGAPARSGPAPQDVGVIATHRSPPLSEIVGEMLRESDNTTAEMLLKELGHQRSGEGSFTGGQSAVATILAEAGFDAESLSVADGSGLASENRLTCDLVMDVLTHPDTSEVISDGLAVAGESGTLSLRWGGTELVGRVRAKTGTLNQVTGLAGEVESDDGSISDFTLVVNVAAPDRITVEILGAQQDLAEILLEHPVLPDVEALRPG